MVMMLFLVHTRVGDDHIYRCATTVITWGVFALLFVTNKLRICADLCSLRGFVSFPQLPQSSVPSSVPQCLSSRLRPKGSSVSVVPGFSSVGRDRFPFYGFRFFSLLNP